ncbi:MAG: hypothetical protein JWN08_3165 [Frankiales bacterium]|nr:hypothetical protein [Frankiales bacterium]
MEHERGNPPHDEGQDVRRALLALVALLVAGGLALPAGAALPPLIPVLPPPLGPAPPPSPTPKPTPDPSRAPAPTPAPTAAPADRWALLVGVTAYRGKVADTVGGAADARLVRDVLLKHGWRSDRIRLLTDDQATGRAVADGLSWLQANSSARTFSVFHYSGHVKQRDGHEFLWPVDNAYIVDTEVSRVLKANRGTSWTNISGCEAAGFDEGLASSRHLFTASSKVTEKSYEDPRTGFSVWSGMLFDEGLRDKAADRDGDGKVSVNEAFEYAAPRAATYTKNQKPHGQQTPQRRGGNGSLNLAAPRI